MIIFQNLQEKAYKSSSEEEDDEDNLMDLEDLGNACGVPNIKVCLIISCFIIWLHLQDN